MVKKEKVNKHYLILLSVIITLILLLLITKFEKPTFREESIDNPLSEEENNIKATLLEGSSDIGVILVHGLGATAFETKKLAQYLNSKNITTYQVLLAGHGKDIYDLEDTTHTQWYRSVEQAYNQLESQKKFIIGSSLGSLLAIELSTKKDADGTILLSTPIVFNDKRIRYSPILRYFQRFHHRDIGGEHQEYYHENHPLKTLAEMIKQINKVKAIIPQVITPTLIIQSKADPRIDPKSPQYIYDNIQSEEKEIMWLNSEKHVLIIDYIYEDQEFIDERKAVFEKVYDFMIAQSG